SDVYKRQVIHKYVNLFETMEIHYVKRNPDDGYDESTLFNRITLKINPDFAYLVNQLTTNFTAFELEEFIALSGKYAKTLYRLLKQFRTTGKAYFEWDEFCKVMDLSLIHISEPTRLLSISYAVFCLKKKKKK
ncbi:hypothetical protein K777_09700, partial [Campylobacter coli CVM 41970]|uniref:replication initiation protein n=1 Tax=Campylobacter coli TaxID=195 RepID=UPI0007076B7C